MGKEKKEKKRERTICMGYFYFFGQESKHVVACLQIKMNNSH